MVNVSSLWTIPPKQHVKICVIDTGYDRGHPGLPADNVTGWVKRSTCGSNNFTSDWDTDESDHGTHVSGIISAIMNYGSKFDIYHVMPRRTLPSSLNYNSHHSLIFKW